MLNVKDKDGALYMQLMLMGACNISQICIRVSVVTQDTTCRTVVEPHLHVVGNKQHNGLQDGALHRFARPQRPQQYVGVCDVQRSMSHVHDARLQ